VALSKTNAGGEVVALTSGGYGPFTVDRSATVLAAPGVYAALVGGGGTAVTVDAGPGARVVIRNLALYGMSVGTLGRGILINSGSETHIENCTFDGFTGVAVTGFANFTVADTTIRNCHQGAFAMSLDTGTVNANLERVIIEDTGTGYAVVALQNAVVTVRDSSVYRAKGECFHAEDGGMMTIENSMAVGGVDGIRVQGAGSVIQISNCVVTGNTRGLTIVDTGVLYSYGNNKVLLNGTDVSGTITPVTQQ
jgi:hypothetical protein